MSQHKIKVGFDLDGVLLYNPARVFRPITVALKELLPKKKNDAIHFYYPKNFYEKLLWRVIHLSSLFIAEGLSEINVLAKEKKIEAYIITSRYDCLKDDFERWLKKMDAHLIFVDSFHNAKDLQPHIFKEQKIKELGLDYFVEDNWDIVRHINKNTKTKALWITNVFDRKISYDLKFRSLLDALSYLRNQIQS
jgi:spore coat polysaccharide biosynthesis predicted glycosyltransferase SpsG